MGINIGLDIGAISLKLAALGSREERAGMEELCASNPSFRMAEWPQADGTALPMVLSDYRRIAGSPIQTTYDLLQELYEHAPAESVVGIRVTGSGSRTISKILGIYFENEFKAVSRMMATFHPEIRTIFEIGGESSKYIRLEANDATGEVGIVDYDRSGECAAGTGSFLDQQSLRMGYSVDEIGGVVGEVETAARIAGRCSVFAKSDMIHAQQKGYSPSEILRGLCDAVARNFKSSIVKGRPVKKPVALVGAVSQNIGVTKALVDAFDLEPDDLVVPETYAWCGAIGAAMLEAEEKKKRSFGDIHKLRQHEAVRQEQVASTPLAMNEVVLLREDVKPYFPPAGDGPIPAYLGIDIGSVSTNVVAMDEKSQVIHAIYLRTAGRPIEAVQAGLMELKEKWGRRLEIRGVGTTGSGRELIAEFVGADAVNDEITAHKTGAIHVSARTGGGLVDTIFEIGGQDSKFISIENGVVVDFAMNEACAAGTGSFLEEQADKLGISIKDEFAKLALSSESPSKLGERCTVFMERDVTGLMHKGDTVPDLVAGLSYSIVLNYLNRVVRGRRIGDNVYFQGGTAYNDAVAAAFAKITGKRITVPPHNGVMGAIGMSLISIQWHQATGGVTRFRGYDLSKLEMKTRDFVCKACTNQCDIKEFNIEGQKSFWGDKCSDKYRKASDSGRKPIIEDLIAFRDKALEEITSEPLFPKKVELKPGAINVGIPRTMSMFDRYPFWHRYFTEIGMNVVFSRQTDSKISARGVEMALAQPCYPVQVAHGHVDTLVELGVDYVFVPNVLDAEAHEDNGCVSHFCPWNQTLPYVLRSAPGLEEHESKFLAPSLHFQLGRDQVKKAMAEVAKRLGVKKGVSDRAVDAAYTVQREFQKRLLDQGINALALLDKTGAPGLVLLGRSYNIYDRGVNCDIPRKLRKQYGANVIPLDFLVTGTEPMHGVHSNMYWSSGQKILEAARMAAARPNLHLIYISNFKCGPDSYIKYFARQTAGEPLLVLQFDGHGNDAGYMTRCEAYLDSKGILRCYNTDLEALPKASNAQAATL
jgi:predicted CoA-substrate-specific enzyme activase